MKSLRIVLAAAFALALAPALAQPTPQVARVRATIETVSADGASLTVRTRAGETGMVRLTPKTLLVLVVPAALADVRPGAFIGVAALPADASVEVEAVFEVA